MKKTLITIVALLLVFALFMGCSNTGTTASESAGQAANETSTAASEETPAEDSSATPSKTEEASASSDGVVKIATKPMTEQFIIGSMLKMLIEKNTALTAEVTEGIGGGTGNIQPAMESGEFDMYPEYTGTGWLYVLKKEEIPDDKTLFEELQKEYKENYNFEWVGMYGFANMYGLVVRTEIAEEHGLKTYSDLAPYTSDLIFAAEYDFFEREDGYDALCKLYGYNFRGTKDLDIGLKYQAINSAQVDVMDIFTTDGQLSQADVIELEDDKKFFPTYYAGTVVRSDTLEKYPELRDVLLLMEGLISTEEMAQMNYQVEEEGKDTNAVAEEFLQSKGLL